MESGKHTVMTVSDSVATTQNMDVLTTAEVRAARLLGNPAVLAQVGPAAPLLAWVILCCQANDNCVIKYGDVARAMRVSVTTVKLWSDSLETLGYYTRSPRGPLGVEIQLCLDAWPVGAVGTSIRGAMQSLAQTIDTLKAGIILVMDTTARQLKQNLGAAA